MSATPIRVLLACPGLDHVARGYESFANELVDVLADDPRVEITLLKGSGPAADHARVGHCVPRSAGLARLAARAARRPAFAYELEAMSFVPSVLRRLRAEAWDVLLTSDKLVAIGASRALAVARRTPRILFSNGGPYPGPFPYADLVHHLTQDAVDSGLAHGEPADRSMRIPYGFEFRPRATPLAVPDKRARRRALDLPEDRSIVVAVGALDLGHKRYDHLIAEVARLGDDRPFLLCLGQESHESDTVRQLATDALGVDGFATRTVPHGEVQDHCDAADVFALASLVEGFPHAYVEGADAGIPCIVNDFPVAHEVLGPWGHYVDMRASGVLAIALQRALQPGATDGTAQVSWIRARYAWDVLAEDYVELIERAAVIDPRPRRSGRARR